MFLALYYSIHEGCIFTVELFIPGYSRYVKKNTLMILTFHRLTHIHSIMLLLLCSIPSPAAEAAASQAAPMPTEETPGNEGLPSPDPGTPMTPFTSNWRLVFFWQHSKQLNAKYIDAFL